MYELQELIEENKVFEYFSEICKIPHGSENTKKLQEYIINFATNHGLDYKQDVAGNIVIYKDAQSSAADDLILESNNETYETDSIDADASEPIILQSHMDMVCNVEPGCSANMKNDPIKIYIDDDYLKAKGTTLGGDDGIGMAIMLAVLDNNEIKHPNLECLFTVDEEIGLVGATELDKSMLSGHKMINLDSEDEGIITVSCAGGARAVCSVPCTRDLNIDVQGADFKVVNLTVMGLKGGHSGNDIDKNRSNAVMVLGEILNKLNDKVDLRIVNVIGGPADNVIPSSASAMLCVDDLDTFKEAARDAEAFIKARIGEYEPGFMIQLYIYACHGDRTPVDGLKFMHPFNKVSTVKILEFLDAVPYGIQSMSEDIEGLVQTSLSLGMSTTHDENITFEFCVRSSKDDEKRKLLNALNKISRSLGGVFKTYGEYPGWQYLKDSCMRERAIDIYNYLYGTTPKIEAIHAGLECGIFAGKIKDLDAISIGPDMHNVHTYNEELSISSTIRTYDYVIGMLERL